MQNEPSEQLEKTDEERLKTTLSNLWAAMFVCGIISVIYFLIKTLKINYGMGTDYEIPVTGFIVPKILGSTLGALLFPFLVSLVFKNKARAFVIAWLIMTFLSFGAFMNELKQMV